MPSVTNANNASICCGVLPEQHGITGNSFFDERTGREEYMETADLLLSPTLFQRAKKQGVTSALLSCKKKTTTLLSNGTHQLEVLTHDVRGVDTFIGKRPFVVANPGR